MRISLIILIISISSISNIKAQAFKKNDIYFDCYFGYPKQLLTYTSIYYWTNNSKEVLKNNHYGIFGLRAEYLLADKFGFGLDVAFESGVYKVKYNVSAVGYIPGEFEQTNKNFYVSNIVTMNYHFIDGNDKLDVSLSLGAGLKFNYVNRFTNDPNYETFNSKSKSKYINMRFAANMKYFFTPKIGVNFSIGYYHGGLINTGVSYKL
jgi:hypothetical protein